MLPKLNMMGDTKMLGDGVITSITKKTLETRSWFKFGTLMMWVIQICTTKNFQERIIWHFSVEKLIGDPLEMEEREPD